MNKSKSIFQVLLAALLFGSSAPISKLLLGKMEPIPMAAFLYIGSGAGLIIYKIVEGFISKDKEHEAPLRRMDIPWLLAAVFFGGVAAPIILMTSLRITPAATASLLLNFEGVATTLIAVIFLKENAGKTVWTAIGLITISSILLSWNFSNQWGFSLGAIGIIFACFCWGIDNNFTGKISLKDPFSIVIIKGIGAGCFSLILALALKNPIPNFKVIIGTMLLGCFSYGFSIVLYVLSLRGLGSTRTSALFGTAPFIGVILSFILCKDVPSFNFIIAAPIMILGTIFLLKEKHQHKHKHSTIVHEHRHCHNDEHHNHSHKYDQVKENEYHSHVHTHEAIIHNHPHTPDLHHRHEHSTNF